MQREFYYTLCINEQWSVRQFKARINSMLYERSAISKLPELTIKNDLEKLREKKSMSTMLAFKDTNVEIEWKATGVRLGIFATSDGRLIRL